MCYLQDTPSWLLYGLCAIFLFVVMILSIGNQVMRFVPDIFYGTPFSIVNVRMLNIFLIALLLFKTRNQGSDFVKYYNSLHHYFYFLVFVILVQDLYYTANGREKEKLQIFVLACLVHCIFLVVLWNNLLGMNSNNCIYFVASYLSYYALECYLQYRKPKLSRRPDEGFFEKGVFCALFFKFFFLTLAFKIQHIEKNTFATFILRDFVLLVFFYIKLWSYVKSIPPTISELFISVKDGIVYIGLLALGNFAFICYSLRAEFKAHPGCVSTTVMMTAIEHLFFDVIIDICFVLLIFFFDTDTRKEKVHMIGSKNFWHMMILGIFIIIKFVIYYDTITFHWLPQLVPLLYFQCMNYNLNKKFNKKLKGYKDQDFEKKKSECYDKMIYENLNCISYEVVFLLTFMSIIQVR